MIVMLCVACLPGLVLRTKDLQLKHLIKEMNKNRMQLTSMIGDGKQGPVKCYTEETRLLFKGYSLPVINW